MIHNRTKLTIKTKKKGKIEVIKKYVEEMEPIIPFDKVSEIKGKEKESNGVLYFIWKNNQLIRAPFL